MNTSSRALQKYKSTTTSKRVLVVEDDNFSTKILELAINKTFSSPIVKYSSNYSDAINAATKESYDLIIFDIFLTGDRTGIDFIRDLQRRGRYTSAIAVSVLNKTSYLKFAQNLEVVPVLLSKPFTVDTCVNTIISIC